ncbi:MAG: phosphoribosylanthranilate isomerase [Mailhella sp.]|nr:phosphoribosylanthranilate isomerase [Mailhella sp.]
MFIKICGMREQGIIDRAAALGVDMCGFIFHEKSPRNVTAEQVAALDTHGMKRVGVFVAQSVAEVAAAVEEARLDMIQLHGGQSASFAASFPAEKIIRVLWPNRYPSSEALQADIESFASTCGMYLLDAGMGDGDPLAWASLRELRFPHPWMLAGGLGPENVKDAFASCHPDGIDLNSRLESSPGRKSLERMERLFRTLYPSVEGDRIQSEECV